MKENRFNTKGFVVTDHIQAILKNAPWVLRITEHNDKTPPVLVIKERCLLDTDTSGNVMGRIQEKSILKDRGLLHGNALRRCIPVLKEILSQITDAAGIPLELHQVFGDKQIDFRGNLPLDEEAGAKLALLFKLQERITDMNRVELIAWRIQRFSREEASYWLTRATMYGPKANLWALAGMRIMLGGQPGDSGIVEMLEKVRK